MWSQRLRRAEQQKGRLVPKRAGVSPGSSSGWQTWAEGPWAPTLRAPTPGGLQVLPSWLAPSCPHGGGSLASAGSTERVMRGHARGPVLTSRSRHAPPAEQNCGGVAVPLPALRLAEGCANMLVEYSTARGFRSGRTCSWPRPSSSRYPPAASSRVVSGGPRLASVADLHASTGLVTWHPTRLRPQSMSAAADFRAPDLPALNQLGPSVDRSTFHVSCFLLPCIFVFLFIHHIWLEGVTLLVGHRHSTEFSRPLG